MISMVSLVFGPDAPADAFADGARALEEVLGEAAVDDGDASSSSLKSARVKVAALEDRDLHRLEVAGRQRVHERLHVLAVGRTGGPRPTSAVPLVAAQDRHGSHAPRT